MIDKLENGLIVLGSLLGLANIQEVMGIILLAFQILLIIFKCVIKVINKFKHNDLDGAIEDIEDLQKELDERSNLDDR